MCIYLKYLYMHVCTSVLRGVSMYMDACVCCEVLGMCGVRHVRVVFQGVCSVSCALGGLCGLRKSPGALLSPQSRTQDNRWEDVEAPTCRSLALHVESRVPTPPCKFPS